MSVALLAIGAFALGAVVGGWVGRWWGLRSSVDDRVGRVLDREMGLPRISDSKQADEAEGQGDE